MPYAAEILRDPALRDVRVLAGDPTDTHVDRVDFLEDWSDPEAASPGTFAVLGSAATRAADGYRLDVLIRRSAAHGVSALLLTGDGAPTEVPTTAAALARRLGVVVAGAPGRAPAELILAVGAAVAGDAPEALRRTTATLARLRDARSRLEPGDAESLLALAGETLGAEVRMSDDDHDTSEAGEPVTVAGQRVGTVTASAADGPAAVAGPLVVALTAAAVERSLDTAYRGADAPIRSRDALLSELLVAADAPAIHLADQAREQGLPIDGWHRAVLLQLDLDQPPNLDFLHALGGCSLRAVRTPRRTWHLARWEESVVLVEMWSKDPGPVAARHGIEAAQEALRAARDQFPQLSIRCGVGTVHQGPRGLRATVTEARAVAGRARPGTVAGYDAAGLRPMLLEWYDSDTARQAVQELLEPLERLGGERATTAIHTLQVYLDEQGSLLRSAERLNVHRNAVAYRMRQITARLNVDLTDADQRFALQLACRARLLR